jgi:hypothetical protein
MPLPAGPAPGAGIAFPAAPAFVGARVLPRRNAVAPSARGRRGGDPARETA